MIGPEHQQAMQAAEALDRAYLRLGHSYAPARKMRARYRRALLKGCKLSELADWRAQYRRLRAQAEKKRKGRWLDRREPPQADAIGFDPFWDSPDNVARLEQTDRRVAELDVAIQTAAPPWLQSWFRFRNDWRAFYNEAMRDAGAGARGALDRYDGELRAWRAKAKAAGAKPNDPEYPQEEKDEPTISLRGIGAAALLGAALLLVYMLKKDTK